MTASSRVTFGPTENHGKPPDCDWEWASCRVFLDGKEFGSVDADLDGLESAKKDVEYDILHGYDRDEITSSPVVLVPNLGEIARLAALITQA